MDIIIKSLLSAVATAVIIVIAKFFGPKLAGAIGGIPIVFAVSYIFVTMNDKTVARDFLLGGVYGALAAIFFSVALIWFNLQFVKTHWLNFALAYILCLVFAFLLVKFTAK